MVEAVTQEQVLVNFYTHCRHVQMHYGCSDLRTDVETVQNFMKGFSREEQDDGLREMLLPVIEAGPDDAIETLALSRACAAVYILLERQGTFNMPAIRFIMAIDTPAHGFRFMGYEQAQIDEYKRAFATMGETYKTEANHLRS
jgi:hypothetical protein